jgi:hypothetical protein
MIHNEEAVNALERVAAEERGVAAERGALADDLAKSADLLHSEMTAITQHAEWWNARYPGDPVASLLADRQVQASARVDEVAVRLGEVVKEQQAHEVAAAALTEDAARARAEWEAEHGRKVATGDRVTKANRVTPPRGEVELHPHISGACIVGQHDQCQEHGDGYPVPGSCACDCPAVADYLAANPPAGPQATVTRVDGEAGQ